MSECPCGSGKSFEECCAPCLDGTREPKTAEELLRARYSAFATHRMEYVRATTHPAQLAGYDEAGAESWSSQSEWQGLEIRRADKGGEEDDRGFVDFVARYRQGGVPQEHHELSEFRKQDGKWYFWDATFVKPETVRREAPKVGRNDPCPCGSGKKYKHCCGR